MKVITKKDLITGVAERWDRQYPRRAADKVDIANKLHALPSNASEADIAEVIGNGSWTKLECDECGDDVDAVVRVGKEPDYGSATARLCLPCVKKALTALRGAR